MTPGQQPVAELMHHRNDEDGEDPVEERYVKGSLVLPFKAKGTFYLPVFFWVLSIFVFSVVHEFCHGLLARRHGIPVKSSGFAFLAVLIPILPAAFVEPEEKHLG